MNCPQCGAALQHTGRRAGANELLKCASCGAEAVSEADESGAATQVDPEMMLDEREGA